MKKQIFIILVLLCFTYDFANYSIVSDSLKTALGKAKSKQQKLPILLQLARELTYDEPHNSEKYANDAIVIAKELNLKKQEIDGILYLSSVQQSYGNYAKALEYLQKCYQMYDAIKDTVGLANCYMNMGNVHLYSRSYQLALDYYLKSLKLYKLKKAEDRIASVLGNIANVYYALGNLDKAKSYSSDALALYDKFKNDPGKVSSYINLGNIESDKKKTDAALEFYEQAYVISKKSQLLYDIGVIQSNKAAIHIDLKKYPQSIREAKEALEISKKISLIDLEINCYYLLSEAYEKSGDYKEALNYLYKYSDLNDSIYEKSKTADYLKFEARFQSEKKQKQIELQKAELGKKDSEAKKQTFAIFALIIIIILIVLLTSFIYRFYIYKKKENSKLHDLNATKDKFFSIIAHDLKNPFNSIIGSSQLLIDNIQSMEKEEYLEFLDIIRKSSEAAHNLLENLLLWARTQTGKISFDFTNILVDEIISECMHLLNNQAAAKNIRIEASVESNLLIFVDGFSISTIFRNLISNALKFTNVGGQINIKAYRKDDSVLIEIQDNGIGMTPDVQEKIFAIDSSSNTIGTAGEKGTGLGLILCKDLVQQNNGTLSVKSQLGVGSTFSICLPLGKNE